MATSRPKPVPTNSSAKSKPIGLHAERLLAPLAIPPSGSQLNGSQSRFPLFFSTETPMPITRDTLTKLAQFDTPTICNVIELFDVRPRYSGFMNGQIKSNFPEMPPM